MKIVSKRQFIITLSQLNGNKLTFCSISMFFNRFCANNCPLLKYNDYFCDSMKIIFSHILPINAVVVVRRCS